MIINLLSRVLISLSKLLSVVSGISSLLLWLGKCWCSWAKKKISALEWKKLSQDVSEWNGNQYDDLILGSDIPYLAMLMIIN